MKTIHITILFSLCILFGGCPYESDVPIDKPSVKVDSGLLGKWEDSRHAGDQYKVGQKDEFTYQVVKTSRSNQEPEKYLMYASLVNGSTFLNIWQLKAGTNSTHYALMKLMVRNKDALNLVEVTDNIDEKFVTSEDLKKFVAVNMKSSYFFGKETMELTRSGK